MIPWLLCSFYLNCVKKKVLKKNWLTISLGFLWENVHLGYGYFLRLDLVGNDLWSGTKSGSTCHDVIITSLSSCYPTFRKKLFFSTFFKNLLREGFKKTIESVIMIIPPPPRFCKTVIALRFFFSRRFLLNWVIRVFLETHFESV